jgi:Family of unknown function (DUF6884)
MTATDRPADAAPAYLTPESTAVQRLAYWRQRLAVWQTRPGSGPAALAERRIAALEREVAGATADQHIPGSTSRQRLAVLLDRGAVVLVGCGAGKLDRPATAAQLYVGSYFRACLLAALALAPRERVLVLSARHGLLGLDDGPLDPYQLRLGQPGAVTATDVTAQAAARGIANVPVVALCGARYATLARQVWAEVATPLVGLGIGQQRHVLSGLRADATRTSAAIGTQEGTADGG